MTELNEASRILGIQTENTSWARPLRTGARTRCVVATQPQTSHRFTDTYPQVVVKLYKGDGTTKGSKAYQQYHQTHFKQLPALTNNRLIQQSIEGGIMPGIGPYAVVQYIEGRELSVALEDGTINRHIAGVVLKDILDEIWRPLWNASLRFKDCHPGNFILTPAGRTIMIDTEQMRKDVQEYLTNRSVWTQRTQHEISGLKRLPALLQRIILAANPAVAKSPLLREIKQLLAKTDLDNTFRQLGRQNTSSQAAEDSTESLLSSLNEKGLIT